MPKRLTALLLIFCLLTVCTLPSCTPTHATARELLEAMRNVEKPLPAGRSYVRLAPQDGEYALTDELLAVTFGNGHLPPEMDEVIDAAVYLSFTRPAELAVFRCKSTDGTDAVAAMCLRRLDYLRNHRTDPDNDLHTYLDRARVTVCGRWVILTVSSDPDAAIRAARRAL